MGTPPVADGAGPGSQHARLPFPVGNRVSNRQVGPRRVGVTSLVPCTNTIESINYQLRKVTKNRRCFPTERAASKLLYLAVGNITTERRGDAGTGTWEWTACLNAVAAYFLGRITIA